MYFVSIALDAMRKAHEAEVQKEVTKFKTEFLKKIQSNHDIGTLHKEHECVFIGQSSMKLTIQHLPTDDIMCIF